jgi:sialate O-acetylesterase
MRATSLYSLFLVLIASAPATANVTLPPVISDHMVLQRDMPVRIWGKADPGEAVNVQFRGKSHATTANAQGAWEVFLPPMPAGGPFDLAVLGRNTLSLQDILIGDVWFASGQSNMVWSVEKSDNAQTEIAKSTAPKIRLYKATLQSEDKPQDANEGSWRVCGPDSVPTFSAVGYFFARHLTERLNVPIGVIQSAWGGTPAEAWTSRPALTSNRNLSFLVEEWEKDAAAFPKAQKQYEVELKKWERLEKQAKAKGRTPPAKPVAPRGGARQHMPAGLYNAMVAPFTPFAIKGVLWYQGENNANRKHGAIYRDLFETMIRNWRNAWRQGDFPFLFVQLANYANTAPGSTWPELREAQLDTLEVRNTGMAVTIDIGNPQDIHPTNKQDVGYRLALAARAVAYDDRFVVYSGPIFRLASVDDKQLRLWFDHAGRGLQIRGRDLLGFEIAGSDGAFYPAEAKIDGLSVLVSSSKVPEPKAVRYGWADSPECNLYNADNLPASPFRALLR